MAISITKPTVGGSEDTWGTTINTALDTIVDGVNGTSGTIAPDLSTLTINGTDVTATAAELNIVDGSTAATATTLAGADRVVVNDDGTMKQVAMTDVATFMNTNLGDIDNGSSNITTTGTISFGTLTDGTTSVTSILDEDNMASDSAAAVPTQQSVKAYVDDLITHTGTAPIFGVRAFCVWNGEGAIGTTTTQSEGNIGTLTKNSTGSWTVTFTTAMPDANYAISFSGGEGGTVDNTIQTVYDVISRSTTGFSFQICDPTNNDLKNRDINSFIVVR